MNVEESVIKILVLVNGLVLISRIEEVGADIGEPDCKLTEPYVVNVEGLSPTLEPWLMSYTAQNSFMMSSDKILTLADPTNKLLETYENLLK